MKIIIKIINKIAENFIKKEKVKVQHNHQQKKMEEL